MKVPILTIVCMAVYALFCFGAPVTLMIVFRRKFGVKIVPTLVGAASFVVFALVLRRLMDRLVLQPTANGSTWISIDQYVFYGLIATSVFEETARFLSFKLLRKRYDGIQTALSCGLGHSGILILLSGVSTISDIMMSIAANAGQFEGKSDLLTFMDLQTTAATPSVMYLVTGVESVFALAVHMALSVIVFYSVYENRRLWLYPAAILLRALFQLPNALSSVGILTNDVFSYALFFGSSAALVWTAVYVHRRLKPEESPGVDEESTLETV